MSTLIPLADGRQIAIGQFGDPDGAPVVFCHGALASWRYRHPRDDIARDLGVRVITAARPGFGSSTRLIGRTVADWAADTAAIADALGIETFAVLGHSGGGPHALACAALLGNRVTAAGVSGSLAPLDSPARFEALGPMMRTLFESALGELEPFEAGLEPMRQLFLASDEQTVATVFEGHAAGHEEVFLADVRDTLGSGVGGWADELRALTRPWGFGLDEIDVPVTLWYGADDELTETHGAGLADALAVDLTIHPGGHQSWLAQWATMLEARRGEGPD